jgi:hypothetical protein
MMNHRTSNIAGKTAETFSPVVYWIIILICLRLRKANAHNSRISPVA